MAKFLIVLHAEPGTHDAQGRALHALLYAKELHDGGEKVKLLFDGGGTKWIPEMADPSSSYNDLYDEVKSAGLIDGACHFCMGSFDADRDFVKEQGIDFADGNAGHPSLLQYVQQGYQIITL